MKSVQKHHISYLCPSSCQTDRKMYFMVRPVHLSDCFSQKSMGSLCQRQNRQSKLVLVHVSI